MTPLRQRMLEDMRLRNLSPETQSNYLHYITGYAKHFDCSPELLGLEAIREYQLYLIDERKLSAQSLNGFNAAARFLSMTTLEMPWSKSYLPHMHVPGRLPVVLSPTEVAIFFNCIAVIKLRAALMVCYGARPRGQTE